MELLKKESLLKILSSETSGIMEVGFVDYIKLQYSSFMLGYQNGYRKQSISKLIDPDYKDIIEAFLKLLNNSEKIKNNDAMSVEIVNKEHLIEILHTESDGKINIGIPDYIKIQYLCYKFGYNNGYKKFQASGLIEAPEDYIINDFLKAINKGNKGSKLVVVN